VDGFGNAYITGRTYSSDFPTENPYQTDQGDADAFVTKLNSLGNSLVYSTYLGGGDSDESAAITVDNSGNAYITGHTESSDFPTENPYQTNQGDADAFVTKLNSLGNDLVYSTYLGGSSTDRSYAISADSSGNAYIAGWTFSSDFPTQGEYQTDQGDADAFVTKLNSSGDNLIYSTYLGGSLNDYGYAISVDSSGNAYIVGNTQSADFPTEGEYQTFQGVSDAFMTKLNSTGNGLVYSTYLGGSDQELGLGISIDGFGNAYITGRTYSSDFPTENPYQTDQDDADAFVTKLNSLGNNLIYSTYLGGSHYEKGQAISLDSSGNAYITGNTQSADFPTENPYQLDQGGVDVFVTKLSGTCDCMPGDANNTGTHNILDCTYLISYLYKGGPAPVPYEVCSGDANKTCGINILDVTYLINYLYKGGPPPCSCEEWVAACGQP
jgi:hypothetical protein